MVVVKMHNANAIPVLLEEPSSFYRTISEPKSGQQLRLTERMAFMHFVLACLACKWQFKISERLVNVKS